MMQMVVNALTLASIYFLFAVGMSLVWGTIGVLNFAHGAIFIGSAFSAFLLLNEVQVPLLGVMAIGIVTGTLLAVAVQLIAFGPVLKREKSRHSGEMQILAAGIGMASVLVALAQLTHNEAFGLGKSGFTIENYNVGGLLITNISVIIIVLALILGVGLSLWVRRSIHGIALRSLGVDARTASLMGINRARMAMAAVAVSGGLAGLSGTLLTIYLGAVESTTGEAFLIKAFAIIVLGGVGSIAGVGVGALLLASAETILLGYTSGSWVDVVSFGMIFAILLLRPNGIFGTKEVRRT